jgi:tetratricopeptide (TPR) repeat protein
MTKASRLRGRHQYEEALSHVSKALKICPDDEKALHMKCALEVTLAQQYAAEASVLYESDKFEEAMACVLKSLQIVSNNKEALDVQALIVQANEKRQLREKQEAEAEAYRAEGSELFRNQSDFKGAVSSYSKAIELINTNTVYYNNRALAYLIEGEYENAVRDCNSSLAIKENPKAYCRKASALVELGQISEALDSIEKSLILAPNNKEALNIRVGLLEAKIQHDKLAREAEAHRIDGSSKIQTELNFEGAIFSYTKAISLVKSNSIYFNNRALAYLLAKKYDMAISDCNASLKIKENPKAYCRRACAYGELGKLDDALKDIESAIFLSPSDKEALNIKIGLLEAKEQRDAKVRMHEVTEVYRDMTANIESMFAFNDSALSQYNAEDYITAVSTCNKSLAIRVNPVALCRKANALAALVDFKEALYNIEMSLKADPGNFEAISTKERINNLHIEELRRIEEERLRLESERKLYEEEKKRREEERKRLYLEKLRLDAERLKELADQAERKRLRDLESLKFENQLRQFYFQSQLEIAAENARFKLSLSFVQSRIEIAKEVVVIHFENEQERIEREIKEENHLKRSQIRARGLRRLENDENELIRAQIYSRKRREKKPPHFIQSDFFSLNLFHELKFFSKTKNDIDINILDSRLEVINPRKESNVHLNKVVNDVSSSIFDQLEKDWFNLKYSIQYTEEEELTISFDPVGLYENGKLSDKALSRYMTEMALSGVTAKAKLRPRCDRWRSLEVMPATEPQIECKSRLLTTASPLLDATTTKKQALVFSFFVPLYNGGKMTIHGNRTLQDELDAFKREKAKKLSDQKANVRYDLKDVKESRVLKNSKSLKVRGDPAGKGMKKRDDDLPPVRVTQRGTGRKPASAMQKRKVVSISKSQPLRRAEDFNAGGLVLKVRKQKDHMSSLK